MFYTLLFTTLFWYMVHLSFDLLPVPKRLVDKRLRLWQMYVHFCESSLYCVLVAYWYIYGDFNDLTGLTPQIDKNIFIICLCYYFYDTSASLYNRNLTVENGCHHLVMMSMLGFFSVYPKYGTILQFGVTAGNVSSPLWQIYNYMRFVLPRDHWWVIRVRNIYYCFYLSLRVGFNIVFVLMFLSQVLLSDAPIVVKLASLLFEVGITLVSVNPIKMMAWKLAVEYLL